MPENKDVSIFVRVTRSEKDAFIKGAEEDDVRISEWFRSLAHRRISELGIEVEKRKKAAKRKKA